MAFRIPSRLLTPYHKDQIQKDLHLKEKPRYDFRGKGNYHSKPNTKEIAFYSRDESSNDLLLPMYYASCLFQRPIINRRRVFHRVPGFKVKTSLYDYQIEVVKLAIEDFRSHGATFLNVFCSFGKTFVAAYFSAMFAQLQGLATLVVYHRTPIASSWLGTFKDLTDAKVYVVGESIGPPDDDVQVFLCMDTCLPKLDPTIRSRIGHFVIDEAHCFCTNGRVQCLLSVEPLYITALTATYERDDGMHVMLDRLVGDKRITRISTRPFFVFKVPTLFEANPKRSSYGIVIDDLIKQLDDIPERNSAIVQMVLDNMNEKILVLTKHVAHADNLHAWLTHYLKPYGKNVSLLAGNVSRYDDASVIVGTISKVGIGFDEKKACHDWRGERINMLILASTTRKVEQIAGRVFRADVPVIVDFVDNHKNNQSHWYDRRKWYTSRNGIIYTVNGRFSWNLLAPVLMEDYNAVLKGTPTKRVVINGLTVGDDEVVKEDKIAEEHLSSAVKAWIAMNSHS